MKPLNFFIIYHDKVFKDNTAGFTEKELEIFTWVAVNEKVPKEFPDWMPNIIKEYEMKIHNPLYQMTNFYQNSAFFHLYWNKELINSKYIGFGQYDMSFNADEMRTILKAIENDTADKIIPVFTFPFEGLCNREEMPIWKELFVNPYNDYYGTSHELKSVEGLPLCLLHTFIMPTWFFLHMMPFVESLVPRILKFLNWDTRHLAGTLERVFALCISFGMIEGKFRQLLRLKGVSHADSQRSPDELRGIK